MEEFTQGLGDAWAAIAAALPKLIVFLAILVIGFFVAKWIGKLVDALLEKIGFDRWVERGGVKRAMEKSQYDASSILGKVVQYALMLFVLQLAFGIWGPNPVSTLIQGVIAYLPNVFVAIIILVVGAAIAAAVKEIVEASLGGLTYGRALAVASSVAILGIAVVAALNQLQIAEEIVNATYFALLAIVAGSAIVAIGGGGIRTMSRYWERAADRMERESEVVREESRGAKQRIQQRAQDRTAQASPPDTVSTPTPPPPEPSDVAGPRADRGVAERY